MEQLSKADINRNAIRMECELALNQTLVYLNNEIVRLTEKADRDTARGRKNMLLAKRQQIKDIIDNLISCHNDN